MFRGYTLTTFWRIFHRSCFHSFDQLNISCNNFIFAGDGSATSDYHSDSVTVGLKSSHNTTPSDNYHESAKPLLAIHQHPDNIHSLRMQGQFR